jgi:hypothetical protein
MQNKKRLLKCDTYVEILMFLICSLFFLILSRNEYDRTSVHDEKATLLETNFIFEIFVLRLINKN